MNAAEKNGRWAIVWLIALLLFAGLACAQAGEVLTPAEATERGQSPVVGGAGNPDDIEGTFAVGDTATLTGISFLVNLLDAPGGRIIAGQQRGAQVTVQGLAEHEGEIWYQIDAATGSGWVGADNLEPAEGDADGEETATDEEDTPGGEESGEAEGSAIQTGETVYLTGVGFLVNMHDQPGGRVIATQERGAQVTILAAADNNGTVWYQIDAPTGEGWVPEENITTEAP